MILLQNGGKSSSKGSHYKGDLLMVRRLMRKLCSVIIDNGCSVNVASLRLVEKLTLPTLPDQIVMA
ncbi:hypothetical protein CR513_36955, partial [Mucuna pruriens]